jgi:hypothetical protein
MSNLRKVGLAVVKTEERLFSCRRFLDSAAEHGQIRKCGNTWGQEFLGYRIRS